MISFDTISYKIMKVLSDFFTPFFTKATNKGLTWNLPKKANAPSVIQLFRLVSTLNIFSKTYELVIKDQNMFCHGKTFSTKSSIKEETCNIPNILISLIAKWERDFDYKLLVETSVTNHLVILTKYHTSVNNKIISLYF